MKIYFHFEMCINVEGGTVIWFLVLLLMRAGDAQRVLLACRRVQSSSKRRLQV